ncbi:MAG: hypothetical protein ABI142_00240, partial [Bryocella sp.]
LGTCNSSGLFSQLTGNFVYMNEVSTVAAAYALGGFAVDSTHIGSGPSALSGVGLVNAFNASPNMYNINAGAAQGALSTTPSGNGTVPADEINSIADMLASCINSTGSTSTNCSTLLTNATSGGTSPVTPTEVSTAAINIVHNPAANVGNLYGLFTNSSPFQPTITSVPKDYSVIIGYNLGSSNQPADLAIDANGNIWLTNNNSGAPSLTQVSPVGTVLSGNGYTNVQMTAPTGLAIDQSGKAWVCDEGDILFSFIASGGTATSSAYTGADLSGDPQAVAIDSNGSIWVTQNSNQAVNFLSDGTESFATSGGGLKTQSGTSNVAVAPGNNVFIANYKASGTTDTVSSFSSSGTPRSSNTAFGNSLAQRSGIGIAIDANNQFWITNSGSNSVTIGSTTSGTASPIAVAPGSSSAGLSNPQGIAFDGKSSAWIANNSGTVSVLSNTGAAVTGSSGYGGTVAATMPGISPIAVDGAGNVWTVSSSSGILFEYVGAATPVVTPLVDNLIAPYSTPASKP